VPVTNEPNPYDKRHEEPADREQRVRERAHAMWEAEGRHLGTADHYWKRAEELIEDENLAAYLPSASRGSRT
jgi:hypothetical protein